MLLSIRGSLADIECMSARTLQILLLSLTSVSILVLSLLPDPILSLGWFSGLDKVQHWLAYALLGFLVYLTIQSPGRNRTLFLVISVFACTMYGGLIEVLQSFTGRRPDSVDFFTNFFGALVGAIVALGVMETMRNIRNGDAGNDAQD